MHHPEQKYITPT